MIQYGSLFHGDGGMPREISRMQPNGIESAVKCRGILIWEVGRWRHILTTMSSLAGGGDGMTVAPAAIFGVAGMLLGT